MKSEIQKAKAEKRATRLAECRAWTAAKRKALRRAASVSIGLAEYESEVLNDLARRAGFSCPARFAHRVLAEALFALDDAGLAPDGVIMLRFEAREATTLEQVRMVERMRTAIALERVLA